MTYEHACLGRGPTDSNSSILYFGFSVFSVIWGIYFSLKANPNSMKTSDSGTVLAQVPHGQMLVTFGPSKRSRRLGNARGERRKLAQFRRNVPPGI
jgi:hypothetical protein